MTRKEAFYSLFPNRERIKFTFTHDIIDLKEFFQDCLDNDYVSVNDMNIEINPESGFSTFDTTALEGISRSLEKEVFAANKTLAAHSFDRSKRNDYRIEFTIKNAAMELENITVYTDQKSKWAKFYYDYDDYDSKNRWKTFFTTYSLQCFLDKDFNLVSAQVCFYDLKEVIYSVYPENEIDVEDMKSKIDDMYELKKISDENRERWENS